MLLHSETSSQGSGPQKNRVLPFVGHEILNKTLVEPLFAHV